MKANINIALAIVIAILVYFLLTKKDSPKEVTKEANFKREYDSSQRVIDSLRLRLKSDSLVIVNLNSFDSLLNSKYLDKKKEIARITANANKPIALVKKYSIKQLDSAFAARYPNDTTKSDSVVTLQKTVGIKSLQDLIRYDTLVKEIPLYKYNDSIMNLIFTNKDSVIAVKDKEINKYNLMIAQYGNQRQILIDERNQDEADLKKSKRKTVVSTVAAAILAILLILK